MVLIGDETGLVIRVILPAHGRGTIILPAACPRTGIAWTSTGTPHEAGGLKHRRDGTIRVVPIPPVLVRILHRHLRDHGTTPDGRLSLIAVPTVLNEQVKPLQGQVEAVLAATWTLRSTCPSPAWDPSSAPGSSASSTMTRTAMPAARPARTTPPPLRLATSRRLGAEDVHVQ